MKDLNAMTHVEQLEYLLWLLAHQTNEKSVGIAEDFYLEIITLKEAIEELENL